MSMMREVTVPDIGDFKNIPIIEILVKPGDRVQTLRQSIIGVCLVAPLDYHNIAPRRVMTKFLYLSVFLRVIPS